MTTEIKFPFNPERTVAVAAMLLRLAGFQMSINRLAKLIYLVDREALKQLGMPLTGDDYVSLWFGVVPKRIYNFMYGEGTELWNEHIKVKPISEAVLIKDPGNDELSEKQERLITYVYNYYTLSDYIDQVKLVPEWKGDGELVGIRKILTALGKSVEEIEHIADDAWRESYISGRIE